MTQGGFPLPGVMVLPRLRSKIPPTHCVLPVDTGPMFISAGLIGHVFPPKDKLIETLVVQGNEKKPCIVGTVCEPGITA